jgi:hydrogenase expression/formation protein HypC
MELVQIEGHEATGEVQGVRRKLRVDLCPEVKLGDFVIVHAGFAIQVLSREEAEETLALLGEILTRADLELEPEGGAAP